ncbi:MAG: RecQ family ATP-dependent DNA helicase [Gemmatimonadetes bacterium]|nr:RecQ family ATP-dependent DNA helicase [Gemmatimonadota bacterium]
MARSLPDAEAVLNRWFGYPSLRAPQRRAVSAVLRGRDTLVVMPTGGGKSLCFQVPALMLDGLTVVLSPLVSLMKDQVDTLVRKGIPAVGLHGGMTPGEQADAIGRVVRREAKMLYVAPERLVAGRTLDALRRLDVSLLAVDEAHCISEWGHDFRPAYRELQSIRAPLGSPPVVALTATATPDVRDDIQRVCALRNPVRIIAGFDRPNLRYAVHRVARVGDRNRRLGELVSARAGPAVVYAQTRGVCPVSS